MRFILLCTLVTLAAASRNHQIIVLKSETPTTEYREQDSKGFYSYGYSSDDSAKAEYKTTDGSSKGFYSYVDSEGKIQTVKYEAGRRQGFTASATNLPIPPIDNSRAPEPVQDTPEVEMAKQAHFEAYREAAIQAAMQPDTGDYGSENDEPSSIHGSISSHSGSLVSPSYSSSSSPENNLSAEQAAQAEAELQQNTRELLMNRQNARDHLVHLLREQHINQQPQLMTTYVLNAESRVAHPPLSELKTVYRLDSSDSKVELKLGGLDLEKTHQIGHIPQLATAEDAAASFESIRVPSNSYYTVNNPNTQYTVETPTVLTTLPRLVSINLNRHHLPISLSTAFSSQRLSTKPSPSH